VPAVFAHNLRVQALQKPLLDASTTFYHAEGDRLILALSVPEYLAHCEVGKRRGM
jgi:hypothetical protein